MNVPRIIFAGTADFAAQHLKALIKAKYHIVAVVSQPDKPVGRGRKLIPTPVKSVALDHNLLLYQPNRLAEIQPDLECLNADLMIVVAYGQLIPKTILTLPRLGCVNIHGSLLPRWRGAAPIQRAIEMGDSQTGISLMQMDEGMDSGDILLQKHCIIDKNETSYSLFLKLEQLGCQTLLEGLPRLFSGQLTSQAQELDQVTYAKKITKSEAMIDWEQHSAIEIERKIRAFYPWPLCSFLYKEQLIKIYEAKVLDANFNHLAVSHCPGTIIQYARDGLDVYCVKGVLRIIKLQMPNAKPMLISAMINGYPNWFVEGQKII